MVMKVTLTQAKELAVFYMSIGLVPMMHGTFGVGKSSIAYEITNDFNLKLIDMRLSQCDPTDMNGFPDKRNGRSTYLPPEDFPLEDDPLPMKTPAYKKGATLPDGTVAKTDIAATYYDGWLLFMDELNSADEDVQAAAYKVILDKKVGQKNIHSACAMIAAGNLETDGAIVNQMSNALATRLAHIHIENDLETFMAWASRNKMDSRITSFLNWKPHYLHHRPENQDDHTFAVNRTWEFADRVFKNKDTKDKMFIPALCGCITQPMTMELQGHIEVYSTLPAYSEIIANPEFITVPDAPGTLWAMLGFIGDHAQKGDMDQLMKFILRLPKEHQVVVMLDIGRKHPECVRIPIAAKWTQANGNIVY